MNCIDLSDQFIFENCKVVFQELTKKKNLPSRQVVTPSLDREGNRHAIAFHSKPTELQLALSPTFLRRGGNRSAIDGVVWRTAANCFYFCFIK